MPDIKAPSRSEKMVKVEFWKCSVVGHMHRSKRSAAACMIKNKGEAGQLKKLQRNLAIINQLRQNESLASIARRHGFTSENVVKAANTSLGKAWSFARNNGGTPYPPREWKRVDFLDDLMIAELNFLVSILLEMEVKLVEMIRVD